MSRLPECGLQLAIQAILFDVFGTVVDWRSSLIRQLTELGQKTEVSTDWSALVDDWRAEYQPAMDLVRSGRRDWTNLEQLHRESLDKLLEARGLVAITEADRQQMVRGWHFLDPWPDAVAGLTRLKRKYIIGTLSNGGVRLLTDLARSARLPWDVIFSSDLFRHYKPDARVYLGAAELLDTDPGNVVLAAAHNYDLAAARDCGMQTAFIPRPSEYGPRQVRDLNPDSNWEFAAQDFVDLALQLGT